MTDGPAFDLTLLRPVLQGVEPYVPGRPLEDIRRELGDIEVVKVASNEGPLPPFPGALAAIQAAASGQNLYPDPGAWALRDALADMHGIDPACIAVGNGVDSLIKILCMALLDPGDELVMCWPSFISHRQGTAMQGATWTPVPLAADGAYDLDALVAAVGPATKIAVVVSPNNPTGGAVGADALEAFLDALPAHVLPVLDEAYFEYLPEGAHDGVAMLRSGRRLVVMRTFSKAYGLAGLRIGWMAGPPDLIAALTPVRNAFDVNALAQAAALASLADAPEHLPARIAMAREGRTRLADGLRRLGLDPLPSEANFVFVPVGEERARALDAALTARGVIVRPAGAFGAPGALRITVGTPEQVDRVLVAMGEALEETA